LSSAERTAAPPAVPGTKIWRFATVRGEANIGVYIAAVLALLQAPDLPGDAAEDPEQGWERGQRAPE
jgi:hypothetical protein